MAQEMEKEIHAIQEESRIGEVQIADEVVGTIAALAAMEVRNLNKGVKVEISGKSVFVDMAIHILYGSSIPKVSCQVQDRVMSAIENMTGLKVEEVNIRVAGVVMETK